MRFPLKRSPPAVALIVHEYLGFSGGVAISAQNIAASQIRIGRKIVVLLPRTGIWLPRIQYGDSGEPVVELPSPYPGVEPCITKSRLTNWLRLVVLYASILFLRFYFRIELFHFQFCVTIYRDLFRILKYHRWPVLITFHGSEVNYHFSRPVLGPLMRNMIFYASHLVTVSSALREKLLQQMSIDPERVSVINNSVSVRFWDIRVASGAGMRYSDSPRIAFLGRLESVKNPQLLVCAFRDVVTHCPGARLLIAGAGSLEPEVRRLVETLHLQESVEFLGILDRHAVMELLSSVQLVAIPSENEGFSLVAAEAQSFGIPIVATRVGGLPEVVVDGKTGLLVSPGDAESFGQALISICSDEGRYSRFSSEAREFASRSFSPFEMAEKYGRLYSRMSKDCR